MLEKLFKQGYFNYSKYILDNINSLNLSLEEACVFVKILDYYFVDGKIHTKNIADECHITKQRLQTILSALMEKNMYEIYLSYNNGVGEEFLSLKPFFSKMEDIPTNAKENNDETMIPSVIGYLEEELQRILSASELEMVTSFINEDHYDLEAVKASVAMCKKKHRVVSIKNITMMFAYIDNPNITNNNVAEAKNSNVQALKNIYEMMGKK